MTLDPLKISKTVNHNFTFRLLFIIFCILSVGFIAIGFSLKVIIARELVQEKETMLFGLTVQLDNALEGTYDDLLIYNDALSKDRETQITVLNAELRDITDFVASGIEGVGVGYYSKALDAILTYGPSDEFQHTVGQSIFPGHQGYEVMEKGEPLVQEGELVRGKILNCMYPVIRDEEVIGYIWANVTLDDVSVEMNQILNQIFLLIIMIFLLINIVVVFITRGFIGKIDLIRDGIQQVITKPNYKLPEIHGELNIIVEKVNELTSSVTYFKSYNRYVLNSVVNGVLALTRTGMVALVNPSFRTLFNIEEAEIVGELVNEVFEEPLLSLLTETMKSEEPLSGRILATSDRIMEVSSNDIRDELSDILGVVFVFRDITLVRQYERQLKENERMAALGEMGLNVAHEIKNPLTAVKGFTQLIEKRDLPEERRTYYFSLVQEELQRVNDLLNEMLIYGGRFRLKLELCSLKELLQELLIIYRSIHPGIEFLTDFEECDACMIRIDKNKITQLLDNLVKNSVDAIHGEGSTGTDRPGTIEIRLLCVDDSVQVKVKDDGPGMEPELLQKIFTPFFSTKPDGSGFGLSLCAEIMEKHQGTITADSVPGEYTEFTIEFNRSVLETIDGT